MLTDIGEALRFLGRGRADAAMRAEAVSAAEALEQAVQPRWVWRVFRLSRPGDALVLEEPGLPLPGTLAERLLRGCRSAAVLTVTLGARYEALHRSWQARDMARAVTLDACASALTEAGCALAEKEIASRFPDLYLTDRFSPGYGDLPLGLQTALIRAVDAERRLGVTVTPSDMLLPVKTVTALIGLAETPQPALVRGCAFCVLRGSCAYRKEGIPCA